MKVMISITPEQLDRITSRLLRDDPRKRWSQIEKKRLLREWVEEQLVRAFVREGT